jgi:hypothetical protein
MAGKEKTPLHEPPLATRLHDPIIAMDLPSSHKWLGFMKIDMFNWETDGLSLFRGDQNFVLSFKNCETTIAKFEKGYFQATVVQKYCHGVVIFVLKNLYTLQICI